MSNQSRPALRAFLISLAVYLALAAGYIDTIDADPSVELAKSLVATGSVFLHPSSPDPVLYSAVAGQRATFVSKLGLASAVVYVPWVVLANGITRVSGLPTSLVLPFLVSLTNCFVTALIVALLTLYFRDRGWSPQRAVLLAFVAGFATLLFPYSKTCQREPLQALCLLGVYVFALRKDFLIAALWMGLGLSIKSIWLVPAFPALCFAGYSAAREKKLLTFLLPFVVVGSALPLFQWWCFGSAFKTGYNLANVGLFGAKWSTPFWDGFSQQVFSYKSGFFILNPIVLFAFVPALRRVRAREWDLADAAIFLSFLLQAILYSCWFNPLGGWNLGPRYLVTVLPILFLFFRRPSDLDFAWVRPRFTRAFIVLSILFQFVHASVKPQQYWELVYLSADSYSAPHWMENLRFFGNKLSRGEEKYWVTMPDGTRELYDLGALRSLQGLNYWWLHLVRYRKSAST